MQETCDTDLIPRLGRFPGGEHGNPLQYSCLENPMDRGAWQATVHGITKSWTWLKRLTTHTQHTAKYNYSYCRLKGLIYNTFFPMPKLYTNGYKQKSDWWRLKHQLYWCWRTWCRWATAVSLPIIITFPTFFSFCTTRWSSKPMFNQWYVWSPSGRGQLF